MKNPAVEMAYAIVELHKENMRLKYEVEELQEYRDKYMDLLGSSIAHSSYMMHQTLALTMGLAESGGMPALKKVLS